jgi:hypothetical protein
MRGRRTALSRDDAGFSTIHTPYYDRCREIIIL